jgi:hypothetical protein
LSLPVLSCSHTTIHCVCLAPGSFGKGGADGTGFGADEKDDDAGLGVVQMR